MHSPQWRSSLSKAAAASWNQAGGSPAATSFSLSRQRKVSKRKATARTLAFGFPLVQGKKWEMKPTRCAQTCFISDPFFALHQRQRPSGLHVNVKGNDKSNNNYKSNGTFNGQLYSLLHK